MRRRAHFYGDLVDLMINGQHFKEGNSEKQAEFRPSIRLNFEKKLKVKFLHAI